LGEPTPRSLLTLSRAFQESKLLMTACALDLFSPLAGGPADAPTVAGVAGVSERGADLMLRALTAMGLLRLRGERFSLTPLTRNAFLPESPGYLGHLFLHMDDVYGRWGSLADAVREGRSPVPRGPASARRDWILAMAANTLLEGREAIRTVDLAGARTLLDLGGGPGAWSLLFARANRHLRVTLFDRPGVIDVAREHLAEKPGAGRIDLVSGDAFDDPPRGTWDAVWISQVLHSLPPERADALIRLGADLTSPGGRLMIHDFVLNAGRTAPRRAAIFSVHMLAVTDGGRSYSFREISGWMREAGLRRVRRRRFTGETSIVIGEKPPATVG
jgi:SAM-dependent methyltransferase